MDFSSLPGLDEQRVLFNLIEKGLFCRSEYAGKTGAILDYYRKEVDKAMPTLSFPGCTGYPPAEYRDACIGGYAPPTLLSHIFEPYNKKKWMRMKYIDGLMQKIDAFMERQRQKKPHPTDKRCYSCPLDPYGSHLPVCHPGSGTSVMDSGGPRKIVEPLVEFLKGATPGWAAGILAHAEACHAEFVALRAAHKATVEALDEEIKIDAEVKRRQAAIKAAEFHAAARAEREHQAAVFEAKVQLRMRVAAGGAGTSC